MLTLSPAFKDRITAIHGLKGQKWLASLPELQTELVERLSLSNLQPIENLSYNYLVFASAPENKSVVLKLGVPNRELDTEILALKAYDGKGTVRLLEANPFQGVLLLERILPGESLLSIEDDRESTRIAARLMKRIWIPAPHDVEFPSAEDWCLGFQRYLDHYANRGPLPTDLVHRANELSNELLSRPQELLLHGDLHHMNILLGENNTWVAVDPKGVIGEDAFEVGSLILNPVPDLVRWPDLKAIQKQRLAILSEELNIDQGRLTAWSFVRAVLSSIWSLEDGEDWKYGVSIAEILRELI